VIFENKSENTWSNAIQFFCQRWKVIITFRLWHARKCHNFIKNLESRLILAQIGENLQRDASFWPIRTGLEDIFR
jgi:hypothetical protein